MPPGFCCKQAGLQCRALTPRVIPARSRFVTTAMKSGRLCMARAAGGRKVTGSLGWDERNCRYQGRLTAGARLNGREGRGCSCLPVRVPEAGKERVGSQAPGGDEKGRRWKKHSN